jgi:hypothetical protein
MAMLNGRHDLAADMIDIACQRITEASHTVVG